MRNHGSDSSEGHVKNRKMPYEELVASSTHSAIKPGSHQQWLLSLFTKQRMHRVGFGSKISISTNYSYLTHITSKYGPFIQILPSIYFSVTFNISCLTLFAGTIHQSHLTVMCKKKGDSDRAWGAPKSRGL